MKKIVIINIIILCFASVFAQNKIDKANFEKLVDYANCQYLMAFIEKNDAGKPYIKDTYEKSVKPVLQTATLDKLNNVPDYSKIKVLFKNNSNNAALQLAEKINERKEKYNEFSDNNSLIESLKASSWKNVNLTEVATKIQNDIKAKLKVVPVEKPAPVPEQEVVKNQSNQILPPLDELQAKIDNLQQQYNNLQNDSKIASMQRTISTLRFLIIICLVVIVLVIVLLFLWYKLKFNVKKANGLVYKFVEDVFFNSESIKNRFDAIKVTNENGANNNTLEKRLITLEQQVNNLQSKVNSIKATENQNTSNQTVHHTHQQSSNSSGTKEDGLYFVSKSNKQLTEQVSNSANASFKIYAINGTEAKFEYIGAVRNENWFEGVCSIENSANDNLSDKKQIITTQPGKVKKENNNWVVIIPAKIKFV